MDSFQRETKGTFYAMAHEAGAVLAANGFSRTSGRVGVACITHGPALTNTVTALVECVKYGSALLVVAGDTAVAEREHLQNVPQREIVIASGAGFEQVRSPQTVVEDVSVGMRRAVLESRPIVLNVPVEFQWADVGPRRRQSD